MTMRIKLSPQAYAIPLNASIQGDTLTINGEIFDFAPLPDGASLPAEAISSDWIVGPVKRIDGEIHLTLILPHGPNPSPAVAFPEPIRVTKAGTVKLPFDAPQPAEEITHVD